MVDVLDAPLPQVFPGIEIEIRIRFPDKQLASRQIIPDHLAEGHSRTLADIIAHTLASQAAAIHTAVEQELGLTGDTTT